VLSLTILDHGDSDTPKRCIPLDEHAEIMRGCYRQLEFSPSFLVGHSVGGMMGMVLAAKYPEELKGLILVDIAPFDSTGRSTRPKPPDHFESMEEARAWLKNRQPGFTPEYIENRLKYSITDKGGVIRLKPMGDVIRGGLVFDLWPYVEKIKTPTMLLIGENSTTVTPEARAKMEKTLPNLESIVVKGTGHMIPQEKPAEFEKLVKKFLTKNQ
jgi:pimeloyl-ACP methyl ester carboxylesterase